MLAVVFAFSAVVVAPASAKLTKHQKAHIRKQLKRAIHKNPKLIRSKRFIKKASLVDFTLPVTIKLRSTGNGVSALAAAGGANPNRATLDLGASLGQRTVNLGGSLAAEIQFHDSYDGGALGNVDLALRPSTTKHLTSTSIPLLWNTDVSNGGVASPTTAWDYNLATANAAPGGCSNFTGAANLPFDPGGLQGGPFPGVPEYNLAGTALATTPIPPFVPVNPGIDDINNLTPSGIPNNLNNLGANPTPFPSGPAPSGFPVTPSAKDAVLRTAPLKLDVATAGTTVTQQGAGDHPQGSQDQIIGNSGGQANLFGNIPGKNYGIDVTVSLATKINSIFRAVDVDGQRVRQGAPWPAALFGCREAFTGSVQNYIPDIRLKGNLKISPAVTPAGDLRIAKVSLSSLAEPVPTHFAVAACLSLYSVLASQQNNTDTTTYNVPADGPGVIPTANLPADTANYRTGPGGTPTTSPVNPDFSAAGTCNQQDATHPTKLTQDAGFTGLSLAQAANGYDSFATSTGGEKVSVAADLTVNDVEADVIIGDR
jgi:hypothetical protein